MLILAATFMPEACAEEIDSEWDSLHLDFKAGVEAWLPGGTYAYDRTYANNRGYHIRDRIGITNATGYRYRTHTIVGPLYFGAAIRNATGDGTVPLGGQNVVLGSTLFGAGTSLSSSFKVDHYTAFGGLRVGGEEDDVTLSVGLAGHLMDYTYRFEGFASGGTTPITSTDRHRATDISILGDVNWTDGRFTAGARGELSLPLVSQVYQLIANLDKDQFDRAQIVYGELAFYGGVRVIPHVHIGVEVGISIMGLSRQIFDKGGTPQRAYPDWTTLWAAAGLTIRF